MNFEASRLRTFNNWPASAVVDARRIAQAGFYYMGQGQEVQCFSCGGRISEWNYGDKVMTRHRWLDPRCPFVINPANSGNVPIESVSSTSNTNTTESNSNYLQVLDETNLSASPGPNEQSSLVAQIRNTVSNQLQGSISLSTVYKRSEVARLGSFVNWPKPYIVTPESLARAGFYYTRNSDTVKCAFCNVMVGHWEAGDDPITEHTRHFPDCCFLIRITSNSNGSIMEEPVADFSSGGINIRSPSNSDGENLTMRDLGVQSHKVAKHPKYSMQEARLETFLNWPGDVFQTPDDLAAAGFYYAGSGDQVKCFHCDGGLRMWDPNDDPWVEHARWYPQCGYIILVKGQPFVDVVRRDFPPLDAEELEQLEQVSATKYKFASAHPPRNFTITEAELQQLLDSPEAVAALQVGIEVSRVKVALKQRAESGGSRFSSPEALINAALDVQFEESPESNASEAWSTPPSSPVRFQQNDNDSDQTPNDSEDLLSESEDAIDYSSRVERNESLPEVPIEPASDNGNDENDECVSNEGDDNFTVVAGSSDGDASSISHQPEETTGQQISIEEENRRLKEARLCKICMDKEISIVFLPCGHLVTCVHCAHSLGDCPVCRKGIKATVRTFLS